MAELAPRLGEEDKYDAIVVDEAQDFSAACWPPTLACLRDQDTGGLYAFLDEAPRGQLAVPAQSRRGRHGEDAGPSVAGDEPCQRGEP